MTKLEQAAQALLDHWDTPIWKDVKPTADLMADLREALANTRSSIRSTSEYSEQAEQEPFDMNDHPPHRLCECRKCMEYFTPLPDCDAFAASGKPIAEQTNTQFMEGYRIGLAEMREKCATVSEQGTGEAVQKAALEILINERKRIAAAIRAIKFEGDTGFRPVSEMIAEHKQDHKKGAAIEKAKMRKTTRAEKIAMSGVYEVPVEQAEQDLVAKIALKNCIYFNSIDFNQNPPYLRYDTGDSTSKENWIIYCDIQEELRKNGYELTDSDVDHDTVCGDVTPMAATVRTKDLTELLDVMVGMANYIDKLGGDSKGFRVIIAANREKNK